MGTTLTGTQIQNTYDGLIKTTDNTAITATTKLISDGLGNDTCIKVGTAGTDFLGAVDFSAATVTGLPGGAAGLVSGTGTDSMKNADSLVTNAAAAGGDKSIALGDGAISNPFSTDGVAIGTNACNQSPRGVAVGADSWSRNGGVSIGQNSIAYDANATALGNNADADGGSSTAVGANSFASAASGVAIGNAACSTGSRTIAIGCGAQIPISFEGAIAIGAGARANYTGVTIGCGANGQDHGIAIGRLACALNASASYSIMLGRESCSTAQYGQAYGHNACADATGAIALGANITASTANTVTVCALETCVASTPTAGGIIMNDAGSVARRLNITAAGGLQIDSTPVGGGGAAGLVSGTGTDSMQSAASLTTNAANACMACSIALGNGAFTGTTVATPVNVQKEGIAIGDNACAITTSDYSFADNIAGLAIGTNALASSTGANPAIAIGASARAGGNIAIAIGQLSCASNCSVALGNVACTLSSHGIAIGSSACVNQYGAIAIGHSTRATAGGFYQGSVAIGNNTCATAQCAVALGVAVTASRADTVAGNQFESKAVGKGIVVTSPDGLTTLGIGIDNTGAIVTYTP